MAIAVQTFTKRSQRSFQQDGLMDIVAGSAILAVAFVLYEVIVNTAQIDAAVKSGMRFPEAWNAQLPSIYGSILVANVWALLSFCGAMLVKQRFVYPRVGYFKPRTAPVAQTNRKLLTGCLIALAVTYGINIVRWQFPDFLTPNVALVGIGYGIGILLIVNYFQNHFVRHIVLAIIAFASSILVASAHLEWRQAFVRFALIMGTSCILAGIGPLIKTLRLPVVTEQEVE